jgi:predicted dehydrogenase
MSKHKPLFHISRRRFIHRAALASLPLWFIERELAWGASPAKRLGPNDRPSIALIGCGGMGGVDAENALRFADIVAICDVDETRLRALAQKLTARGKSPQQFHDYRKLLERDDIHAIVQATPDHWHTLINIGAAQAGKDVYAEKPLTLTVDEGRRTVVAVRKHGIVLQTGSQQRSSGKLRMACELVRAGRIGQLKAVTVFLPAGPRQGPFATAPVPEGLDWDRWLGQTPKVEYVPQRCHATFRYWFDYSGGTMTDWGAHHNDIARWAINEPGPIEISGRPLAEPIPGGYTTFSEFDLTLTYGNGVTHYIKSTTDDNGGGGVINPEGQRNGVKFEGTNGWIWATRTDIEASDEDLVMTPLPAEAPRLEPSRDHMENFFDCVRSRKDPICHAEVGHRSATVCHMANIALRLGRKLRWDHVAEQFIGEGASEANTYLSRVMRKPYDYSFNG